MDKLILLRKRANKTQEEIGEVVGLTKKQYARLERGELKSVKFFVIQKLAEYYGVTTDFILGNSSEIEDEIANVIKLFTEEQQGFILETLIRAKEIMQKDT